jgi:hypothetical protein
MRPSWRQMFEPIPFDEREQHSLIGEIEPSRTALERAHRRWGMEEPERHTALSACAGLKALK